MKIREYVVRTFAEWRHKSGLSLRDVEREIVKINPDNEDLHYSDTYISQVESRRIDPSNQFVNVINQLLTRQLLTKEGQLKLWE